MTRLPRSKPARVIAGGLLAGVFRRTAAVTLNSRRISDGLTELHELLRPETPGDPGRVARVDAGGVIAGAGRKTLPAGPRKRKRSGRNLPERGYDDPTAHCFPAGVPRSMYVPAAFHIIQTPEYIVFLHERMSWRIVPLDGRAHIPDTIRLWQGDSSGAGGRRYARRRQVSGEQADVA